jgi:hypothetical protein
MPGVIQNTYDPVVLVRELHADEDYVMTAFERHASHCRQCANPLEAQRQGRTLCDRGRQYAVDVAKYLYSKNGKAYSVVARERNQPTLVKIPHGCPAVRGLLLAIEDGLRLHRKEQNQTPVISYDRNYHVPARRPTMPSTSYREIIEREPRTTTKRRRIIVYPSPRGSPSRGSLYDADAVDRIERYYESSRVYRPAEYYR